MNLQVSFWLYAVLYCTLLAACFPIVNVSMNTLFSKILGARRQVSNTQYPVRAYLKAALLAGHNAGYHANVWQSGTDTWTPSGVLVVPDPRPHTSMGAGGMLRVIQMLKAL